MNNTKYFKLRIFLVSLFVSHFAFAQELKYELLFEVKAVLDTPIRVGKTPLGTRSIHPVKSGTIEGPKIKGELLPNGGDWLLTLDSTTAKLDVRAVIKTVEGEIIYISYSGFRHKNPDGTYNYRTNPIFETSSKKYDWLNYTIAVGVGRKIEGGLAYYIYAIK